MITAMTDPFATVTDALANQGCIIHPKPYGLAFSWPDGWVLSSKIDEHDSADKVIRRALVYRLQKIEREEAANGSG